MITTYLLITVLVEAALYSLYRLRVGSR